MNRKTTTSMLMCSIKTLAFLLCGAWFTPALAATIILDNLDGPNEGFNDNRPPIANQTNNPGTTLGEQRLAVMQAAADFWGARLESDVIIRISVNMDPLFCSAFSASLGQANAVTAFRDFTNAPRPTTFYPVALANSLAGRDLSPNSGSTNNDISAVFNSAIDNNANCLPSNWWLGINSPPAIGTISLFNSVQHEIAHGLGFVSLVDSNGAKLMGIDDAFSIHLYDEETDQSWSDMTNAERVASMINTGNLVWRGDNATNNSNHLLPASRTNGHIRMFAPNPRQPGSSVSHWDTIVNPDEVMEPILTLNPDVRATLQLLRDVGWNLITGTLPTGPGQISFVTDSFSAVEGQGPVSILLSRSAGSDGAVSVQLRSRDVTAIGGGEDYYTINQRVEWADGETGIMVITTGIVNDDIEEEGGETAEFSLSNPRGGATISQSTSTLTIRDAIDPNDPNTGGILNMIVPVLGAINRDR